MVKLKFWSIYSHIETSVIKIMRDIHANTLFVVKCSKKAPSQAKWWDLSDLHIQNLGEIDKIWVSVKIWMIQYNLSFCIRTENTSKTLLLELPFATIRMQSYYSYSAVTGTRVQNLSEIKTKWAIRNMGKHRNFCHPHPRGQEFVLPETSSSSCDNVTCCDHWPVERDTQWSHAPLSGWPGSHGVTCAWPHNGPSLLTSLNWPQSSATCHREHQAKQNPLKLRTKNTKQDKDGTEICHSVTSAMGMSLGNVTNVMLSPQIWDFIVDIRQERYCVNYKRLGERESGNDAAHITQYHKISWLSPLSY